MSKGSTQSYGIGAVARRTGLSASNIRMWESRYGAVVPERTATNRRLYSSEDVERLTLLRTLTQRGHAISNIATLTLDQLRECLAAEESIPSPSAQRNRALVVGRGLDETLSSDRFVDMELVARFEDLEAALETREILETDLAVIETETLFPETISAVRELVRRTKASRSILIYHFTTAKAATALARAIPGLQLLKAPVGEDQLVRACLVQLSALRPNETVIPIDSGPLPERLYNQEQLARLARISTTVECECPQHLAGLLQSLSAFEKYSRECEDRNPQDALLHAFLHRTTARVRRSMEEALQHVVQSEGIVME